jgi:Icc-related predicted phosphoesterase
MLVLAGDLTNRGTAREAEILAEELVSFHLPTVGVLGNHDLECGEEREVTRVLCQAGVILLDEEPHEVCGIGFAGNTGFCGGFDRHMLAPFGEALIKRFVRETVDASLKLESGLARLRTERKVAVTHYAPIRQTVEGEPLEIYPFLGSSRLAEPLDRYQVDLALHGHAHHGAHEGRTLGGVPIYNVAYPLMRTLSPEQPFFLIEL